MRHACRLLLRLYPRRWRARYEGEVIAVLEQHDATIATHLDLLAGALDAWRQAGHPMRRETVMATPQSRIMLRAGVLLALVAQTPVLPIHLELVIRDDVPTYLIYLAYVGLAAGVLLCVVAGAYVAARGWRLPVGLLAGAFSTVAANAFSLLTILSIDALLTALRVQPYDTYPLTAADALQRATTGVIDDLVYVAIGAALGAAGWAGQHYTGRRAAAGRAAAK